MFYCIECKLLVAKKVCSSGPWIYPACACTLIANPYRQKTLCLLTNHTKWNVFLTLFLILRRNSLKCFFSSSVEQWRSNCCLNSLKLITLTQSGTFGIVRWYLKSKGIRPAPACALSWRSRWIFASRDLVAAL